MAVSFIEGVFTGYLLVMQEHADVWRERWAVNWRSNNDMIRYGKTAIWQLINRTTIDHKIDSQRACRMQTGNLKRAYVTKCFLFSYLIPLTVVPWTLKDLKIKTFSKKSCFFQILLNLHPSSYQQHVFNLVVNHPFVTWRLVDWRQPE